MDIPEEAMIVEFLKEVDSPRFGLAIVDQLRADNKTRRLIDLPDLQSSEENTYRKELLAKVRGYGKDAMLFESFPSDVRWKSAVLGKSDLTRLKYINDDYWNELSNGSRLVQEGARSILAGVEIMGQSSKPFFEVVKSIEQGEILPQPILVACDETSDLVVLEGHVRLTA